MKDIEIEIQVRIENNGVLLEFLHKNGEFKSEKRQIDEYFSPAHRNFIDLIFIIFISAYFFSSSFMISPYTFSGMLTFLKYVQLSSNSVNFAR